MFLDTRCRIYFWRAIYYKVGKRSLSVYVRNSWMNKEQSINHTKFQFSDRTFCNYIFKLCHIEIPSISWKSQQFLRKMNSSKQRRAVCNCRKKIYTWLISLQSRTKILNNSTESLRGLRETKHYFHGQKKNDFILTFCTQRQTLLNDVLDATWRHWHITFNSRLFLKSAYLYQQPQFYGQI